MNPVHIRQLDSVAPHELNGLCDVLIDCVEGGASVNFLWPMTRVKAERFWLGVADGLAHGDRALLVAEQDGRIVGTVQAVWASQENQPHRADVAKMLVRREARKLGVGAALLRAAEEASRAAGKTLLVLDTASDSAERLYERAGWQRVGRIPDYALMPDGASCDTHVFYKRIG